MKRGKKDFPWIWGILFALFLFCASLPAQTPLYVSAMGGNLSVGNGILTKEESSGGNPVDLNLYATAAVLMDADSGRVLYGKNEDAVMAMASTTKIMTCIIVLENADLDDELTVSAYAASMPEVKLSIRKGERYQVRDLLHSLMLESHNDAAVALAEHIGKQYLPPELRDKDTSDYTVEESRQAVSAFAGLMNAKAEKLGCGNTWFITPNGLDATESVTLEDGSTVQKEHCTTARELATILSYCIGGSRCSETFLDVTRTQNYSFSANGRSFSCVNHNAFLSMMEGALTGKTGFTNKAGYCYVGALEREGRTFVVALLACGWPNHKTYKWSDTRKLMEYGIDHYFYRSFLAEGTAFEESRLQDIPVENGQTESLDGSAFVDIGIPGRLETEQKGSREGLILRSDEQIVVRCHVKKLLQAPVEPGTVVGKVEYLVDDTVYLQEEIVTLDGVDAIDLRWCARQIFDRYLVFGR